MKADDRCTARTVIDLLAERFPKTFYVYQARRKPLKVGIARDLEAALNGTITERELQLGLGWYCRNRVYRAKLLKGAWRIDLHGDIAATISENLVPASKQKMPEPDKIKRARSDLHPEQTKTQALKAAGIEANA